MPRLHPHATFTNNIFKESTATYLGVGSPAFRNMVGCFINNGNDTIEMKDIYGNDIYSANRSAGGSGYYGPHKIIQKSFMSMGLSAGFLVNEEVGLVRHMMGRIQPQYVDQVEEGSANEVREGAKNFYIDVVMEAKPWRAIGEKPAFLEDKSLVLEMKGQYSNNAYDKALKLGNKVMVEKRAEEVKKQWKKRLQNIEGKYGDETKPFEEYYRSNYGGGMMPITFGRYGEINGEGMDLVKELAKEVVNRVRTDEINLPKFKDKEKAIHRRMLHFIGCTATLATVKMKLEKRRMLRRTAREAKEAAEIYKAAKRDVRSNNGRYNETAMRSTGIIADKETLYDVERYAAFSR